VVVWVAGLLVVLAVLAGWWLVSGREPEAARRARSALDRDDVAAAGPLVSQWLAARPDSAAARFAAARLEFARGRLSECGQELERAEALGHDRLEVMRLRGFWLVRQRRYAEAEPLLAEAWRATSGPDVRLDEALARVYLQTYKLERAREVLARWMRDAPGDARPWLWHTEIDRRDGTDASVAIGHFRGAIERDPKLLEARLGLAETLRASHRNAEAAGEFAAYLAARPDDTTAGIGAGINAMEAGDLAAAARYLDAVLQREPTSAAALKERARLAQLEGGAGAALPYLERAIAADPHDGELYHRRSLALAQMGRVAEAEADRRTFDRLRAEQDELRVLRNKLNREPGNNALRLDVARWMFAHGQGEAGVQWVKTILAEQPGLRAAHAMLAEHYDRAGQPGLATFHRVQAGTAAKMP
jgi:predicted Zn-dependent protease